MNEGRCGLERGARLSESSPNCYDKDHMKHLKNLVKILLMITFLGSLAGCDKLGLLGKEDAHGHSHE